MIPAAVDTIATCDACSITLKLILKTEDIESAGWIIPMEEALRERGWEPRDECCFCPSCIEKALSEALDDLVRRAMKGAA